MRSKGYVTASASGGKITVLRPGRTVAEAITVDRSVGTAAVAGDWVLVDDDGVLPIVIALLGTSTGSPTPADQRMPPDVTHGSDVMPPTWSGTWRDGAWRSGWNDLVQGSGGWGLSQGAAFYGRRPASLGVTFASGSVHLVRETYGTYGAGTPTMRLLADSAPGAAYPTVVDSTAGPALPYVGSTADWALPAAWLTHLAAGTAGGIGIGVAGSTPYMRIDGPSMRLSLSW